MRSVDPATVRRRRLNLPQGDLFYEVKANEAVERQSDRRAEDSREQSRQDLDC